MNKEIGTLVVVVLKARNLIDKHSFFKQDVYTKVTLNGVTKQTRVEVKGGQHPEWDDELRFTVTESAKKKVKMLEVACWSKEPRTDDLVGKGEVDITETLKTGEFDDWVPLTTSTGSQRGEVYLEMTFFAAGPSPPLVRRPSKLDPATRLSRPSTSDISSTHLHQGLQDVLAVNGSHRAPPSFEPPLPSLPEETSPSPPTLTTVPTLLRPGAGRGGGRQSPQPPAAARPQSTSPHVSPQASPRPTHQAHSPISTPHSQPSLDSVPGILRAGPSHGHTPSTGDLVSSQGGGEVNVPSMPAAQINSYVPVTSEHTRYQSSNIPNPYPQPNPYQQSQPPRPISTLQSTSVPVPALPSTPTPAPAPMSTYSPSPAPGPWHQSPPPISQPLPTLQPSTYNVDPVPSPHSTPGFSFPAPQLSIPSYNSPPPPPSSYPTYPPAQSAYYPYTPAGPPHSQPRPYPYNYPPPPRDPDLDAPDLFKNPRYSKPLPLPDEPAGMVTPTQGHPFPTRADLASDSSSSNRSHGHSHNHKSSESEAERDRLLALAIEREEEERKRKAAEQEEADRELARKLDLELNLDAMDEQTETEGRATSPRQPPDMPGSWYRHRVEA